MNPMIVLKLLDLAALGFAAWERYDERKRQGNAALADIDDLRRRILAGSITDDEASSEIDRIAGSLIEARKSAIGKLPVYAVGEFDD
jgi:hypothetical protein